MGCIKYPKRYERIWFCSKILTLKQIIKDNVYNTFPFESISSEKNYILLNGDYLYYLEHSSQDQSKNNYKKCGILDTNNNIMCIPQSDTCPINEITKNSQDNSSNYTKFEFFDYELYFSNKSIEETIITSFVRNNDK